MATREQVSKMISQQLGIKEIESGDRLREDLGMESLDVYNLITALKDRFRVVIHEEDTFEVETVGDLCSLVESRVQGG